MKLYQQTLDLFGLNSREPMNEKLLLNKGARAVISADANVARKYIWDNHNNELEKLLEMTFHSYELDRQMPMRWLLDNESDAFFTQRDIEIEKGQGRVKKNHMYKEVGYKYLIGVKG
jgi:hypothetical protein